jgi:guanine deaminase
MNGNEMLFLQRAIALALENARSANGGPFGAVIVREGKILAEGVNRVTSRNDPTAHAEIVAIREACRKLGSFELRGCELYASCEPCPMCASAIHWARPVRVIYGASAADAAQAGFDDSIIARQLLLSPTERSIPMIQRPVEDALAPFQAWAAHPGKIRY